MKKLYPLFALLTLTVSACEDSEDPAADVAAVASDATLDEAGPAGGGVAEEVRPDQRLRMRLRTAYASDAEFEYWYCRTPLIDAPVAYLFPEDAEYAEDSGTYVVIHPSQGFEASFRYSLLDEETVVLEYTDSGVPVGEQRAVYETIANLSFDGTNQWTGESSTDSKVECERRQSVIPLL